MIAYLKPGLMQPLDLLPGHVLLLISLKIGRELAHVKRRAEPVLFQHRPAQRGVIGYRVIKS